MFRITTTADENLLGELLYEIVHWRVSGDNERPPLDSILTDRLFALDVADWGRPGDLAVVALDANDRPAGSAWTRDGSDAQDVRIAVYPDSRRRGVGRLLLGALGAHAVRADIGVLTATVERANPATALFVRGGYEVVDVVGNAVVMQRKL